MVVYHRLNYYNGVVIAAKIIQIIRLFSSFTVLFTRIGSISVTLIAVANKADNAIFNEKSVFWLQVCYRSIYYNFVVNAAWAMLFFVVYCAFEHCSFGCMTQSAAEIKVAKAAAPPPPIPLQKKKISQKMRKNRSIGTIFPISIDTTILHTFVNRYGK